MAFQPQRVLRVEVATRVAAEHGRANLIVANNVLAHVPDINDFVGGIAQLLDLSGFATIEFPHLLNLIEGVQFDTIYHEHFSYLSVLALVPLFARHGLAIFDVQEIPTHGGSLRIFVGHTGKRPAGASVTALIEKERAHHLDRLETYPAFGAAVMRVKRDFLEFLIGARRDGKTVGGYGAAAKATTLLNFAGARTDFIRFVADKSPHKQGRLIAGVRVPIVTPGALARRATGLRRDLPLEHRARDPRRARRCARLGRSLRHRDPDAYRRLTNGGNARSRSEMTLAACGHGIASSGLS